MKSLTMCLLLLSAPVAWTGFPPTQTPIASCENHWFLKETKDPGLRVLGFAYIDPDAGFTFEYDSDVAVGSDGALERKTSGLEKARMIVRVRSNDAVACLDDEQVAKLGLNPAPDWLKYY